MGGTFEELELRWLEQGIGISSNRVAEFNRRPAEMGAAGVPRLVDEMTEQEQIDIDKRILTFQRCLF